MATRPLSADPNVPTYRHDTIASGVTHGFLRSPNRDEEETQQRAADQQQH